LIGPVIQTARRKSSNLRRTWQSALVNTGAFFYMRSRLGLEVKLFDRRVESGDRSLWSRLGFEFFSDLWI
jgi:hypothetical protein